MCAMVNIQEATRGQSKMIRTTWTYHSAGQILFGPQATRQLGEVAGRLGARRLLVVTDAILLKTGLVEHIHAPLSESGVKIDIFPGGEPEPSLGAAETAINQARTFRPDAILG